MNEIGNHSSDLSSPLFLNAVRLSFWKKISGESDAEEHSDDFIVDPSADREGCIFDSSCECGNPVLLAREVREAAIPMLSEDECNELVSTPKLLLQLAPMALTVGAHLNGAIQLAHVHSMYGALMLRVHARLVGNGDIGRGQAHAYNTLLGKHGIALPEIHSVAFAFDPRIDEESYVLPVFLMSLGQSSSDSLHMAIGAALLLATATPKLTIGGYSNEDVADLEDAARHCVEIGGYAAAKGIEDGFASAKKLFGAFIAHLRTRIALEMSHVAERRVLEVLRRVGTCPLGYHKHGRLDGEPIDSYFTDEAFSPLKILRALARSPYVVPGAPEKSRIATDLTGPNGPMFRIFSDDDLADIREWIRRLRRARAVSVSHAAVLDRHLPVMKGYPATSARGRPRLPGIRELYYRLVNLDLRMDGRMVAHRYASRWLARHAVHLCRGRLKLPFDRYSHASLRDWLSAQHSLQVSEYQPLRGDPEETREQVVRDALQLAPLITIDGAWLRGFLGPAWAATSIGATLYRIYADEQGNGEPHLHHGNIYRELLRSMGHELPEFTSREFANHPAFDECAFRVPVFWLSVSLFPRDFLSEILGLNLAMELSGVGGQYRHSGEVLKHYGFSAKFTDLHNSIDNIATGHAAWAREAIESHLDHKRMEGGVNGVDVHWRRVWTGYRSLRPPPWYTRMFA